MVPLADGGYRLFYEATRAGGSHDLRTELIPVSPDSDSDSDATAELGEDLVGV